MKAIFAGLAALMGVIVLSFGLNALGMVSWSFFGSWGEQIRYDIHKESQAHRDGLQRNLMALQTDYLNADTAGKVAIRAAVRHQYSQVNADHIAEMPPHLRSFLAEMGL